MHDPQVSGLEPSGGGSPLEEGMRLEGDRKFADDESRGQVWPAARGTLLGSETHPNESEGKAVVLEGDRGNGGGDQ